MGFLALYKAIYDYESQTEGELSIAEADLLYILEKGDEDCWWKAKKKASEVGGEEPVGLVPNNYIEEAQPISYARALYDYTRQTDEELSFTENSHLDVFDTSDPNWILVGLTGEYGFAPSNYIEIGDFEELTSQNSANYSATRSAATTEGEEPPSSYISSQSPNNDEYHESYNFDRSISRVSNNTPKKILSRSQSPVGGLKNSPSHSNTSTNDIDNKAAFHSPQGFRMYNINEMISEMGRRKKIPTILGISNATGVILVSSEKSAKNSEQRWTADKMTHYSIEGKHVFLELVQPKRSFDFHAGARDTAQEIVAAFGELAGVVRAEGLREVIMAASDRSHKKGLMLYDFSAQEDNEVSVSAGDEIILIDGVKDEDWWRIRRLKDGIEGVVPSSHVEITGVTSVTDSPAPNFGRSIVEQNRLDEQRLAKDSIRAVKGPKNTEVGPGMRLPERGSSLSKQESNNNHAIQRHENNQSNTAQSSESRSRPDPSKVRTWNDRSKSFSVEAQLLALKDGKINLHKMNGVKIAVPVSKMSLEDLEYVERQTGISLDDEKPLSGLTKSRSQELMRSRELTSPSGVTIQKKEHDWFQFFLDCEVSVNLCERYSQAFQRDSIDESVLSDIDATVLRALGIREGDIIKIMRFLDKKYCRSASKRNIGLGTEDTIISDTDSQGGLFSGLGGTLKNNTRKSRPTPSIQTSNTVKLDTVSNEPKSVHSSKSFEKTTTDQAKSGFEDDAWNVKPPRQNVSSVSELVSGSQNQSSQKTPVLTGAMEDLSLLSKPLEPQKLHPPTTVAPTPNSQSLSQIPQIVMPSFFAGIASQQTGLSQNRSDLNNMKQNNQLNSGAHYTGQPITLNERLQFSNQVPFLASAPNRPLSAPIMNLNGSHTLSSLQPQMTGVQTPTGFQQQITPYSINSKDPVIQQLSNGLDASQAQANMIVSLQQPNYNLQKNQVHSAAQPNYQQFPVLAGVQQQNFPISQNGPFSSFNSPQYLSSTQPTESLGSFPQQKLGQPAGINYYLPPPLQPTPTTVQQNSGFDSGIDTRLRQIFPSQNSMSPLMPQKTGPPPVKFGVSGNMKKLVPQVTGRRANLSQATPQNPFGF